MFFLVQRVDNVALSPKSFGKQMQKEVHDALRVKVEGKCTGKYGFTIIVTEVIEMSKGRLDEDSGYAHFEVTYRSLVFRPFLNEILLAKVSSIDKNGFIAQAGPVEIFVSQFGLPSDLKFEASGANGNPVYHSVEEDIRIEIGSEVRVKIVGLTLGTNRCTIIGIIKEDFLG